MLPIVFNNVTWIYGIQFLDELLYRTVLIGLY